MKIISRILAMLCVVALGFTLAGSSMATADPNNVGKVRIIEYGPNAPGTDTMAKRNYEFLRLLNTTGGALDIEGWWVQDNYPHVFKFKGADLPLNSPFRDDGADNVAGNGDDHFVMPSGGQVYVYNGSGTDGNPTNLTAAIYRNYVHHFNNAGDTLRVKDADGTTVHWVTYTPYRVRIG